MENTNTEETFEPTSKVAELDTTVVEIREQYIRLAAYFQNFRKRTARDQERRAASQKDQLVRDILPVLDNLERALVRGDAASLPEGVEMILNQIIEVLSQHGFQRRDDLGQPFDGRFHHALAVGCKHEAPDHSVIEVWERGWMRGDQMFRPAKVLVNKLAAEASPTQSEEAKHS
jgi:molecular chaperone GrpE